MNLTALIAAVRAQMGTPSTDQFYTDAVLTTFINNAIQYISLLGEWPWLLTFETITTAQDDANYDLPDDFLKTKSITSPSHVPLKWVHQEFIKSGLSSNGRPCYFYVGSDIELYPTPVEAIDFTHNYYKQEPFLASGGDTPILPVPYQFAIVHWAAKLAWDRGQRDTDAQRELNQFNLFMKQVLKKANPTSGPITPKVI